MPHALPGGCRGPPSAGGLWLGGVSQDRGGGPPQMGLHVAGQLGRGLAVHAAQFAQDAVSPRGLEPMVLHRMDAQVCCRGEAYGGGGLGGGMGVSQAETPETGLFS